MTCIKGGRCLPCFLRIVLTYLLVHRLWIIRLDGSLETLYFDIFGFYTTSISTGFMYFCHIRSKNIHRLILAWRKFFYSGADDRWISNGFTTLNIYAQKKTGHGKGYPRPCKHGGPYVSIGHSSTKLAEVNTDGAAPNHLY